MIRNYLTVALRFMARQKGFSFINIAGLTLGIASALLIILYVDDELNFDRFHEDAGNIYRVTREGKIQGKRIHSAYTGYPLASALTEHSRDVESCVRIASWPTFPMRYEDRAFTEPNLLLVDSNFFDFFSFTLVEGDPHEVLKGEGKLVITESAARRYFDYKGAGDLTPIGKKMTLAQGYYATITGIAKDPPLQSHFHFTVLLSLDSWDEAIQDGWTSGRVITYVKLKPNATVARLTDKLEWCNTQFVGSELIAQRNIDFNQFRTQGNDLSFGVQPLTAIHLTSDLTDEIEANGSMSYIYLFISIAAFVTFLACINFMNLSTARSSSRAKEIGVRKAVGAPAGKLIGQFLIESFAYIVIAVLLALFIVTVVVGPFNYFTGKELDLTAFLSTRFLVGLLVFVLVVGLLSGSYPAFYLTRFSPTDVLKGKTRMKTRRFSLRNVLVVFQFFISSCLIIATFVVYLQLHYMQDIQLGFEKQQLINLIHTANLRGNGEAFKQSLLSDESIVAASYCNRLPPNVNWQYHFRPEKTQKDFLFNVYEVDHDHLETMKYSMARGRFFSRDYPSDTAAVILNETAASLLGIAHVDGQRLYSEYGEHQTPLRQVIGIIKDFNFQSVRDSIQPVAIVLGKEPNWEMAIRVKSGQERRALNHLQSLWKKYAPDAPFDYSYLHSNFEEKHHTEKRVAVLFLLLTGLAILIACLGLFGLATFTTEQRTKEIGIRKVLGASVEKILFLLNKDFLKLVGAGNLIAWPAAAWLMTLWLNQFAYHIVIPWWIFPATGVLTCLIAFVSVSSRAFSAAKGDPVNSLRDE